MRTETDVLGVLALICTVISASALVLINRYRNSKWADAVLSIVFIGSMSAGFSFAGDPEGWLEMSRPLIGLSP